MLVKLEFLKLVLLFVKLVFLKLASVPKGSFSVLIVSIRKISDFKVSVPKVN